MRITPGLRGLYCVHCIFRETLSAKARVQPALKRLGLTSCNTGDIASGIQKGLLNLEALYLARYHNEPTYSLHTEIASQLIALGVGETGSRALDPEDFDNISVLDAQSFTADAPFPFVENLRADIRHLRVSPSAWACSPIDARNFVHSRLIKKCLYLFKTLETLRLPQCCAEDSIADAVQVALPGVLLSFDDEITLQAERHQRFDESGQLDAEFAPGFWAFVDDAKRVERRRRA